MAGNMVKRTETFRKRGNTKVFKSRRRSDDNRITLKSLAMPDRLDDINALRKMKLTYLAKSINERRNEMKHKYMIRTKTAAQVSRGIKKRYMTARYSSLRQRKSRPSRKRPRRTGENEDEEEWYTDENEDEEECVILNFKQDLMLIASTRPPKVIDKLRLHPRRNIVLIEQSEQSPIKGGATTTRSKTLSEPIESPKKSLSLFAEFLPPKPIPRPTRTVSCLTCGTDIPVIKSAKLSCGHHMCNFCLKRIFTMSVTDPAHMPPQCCTDRHIPLKHVDKLFDNKFKSLWNHKFEEYKSKNRIYCPSRKCSAWIKPRYITIKKGRKVGRCERCNTRVCGICSQKMHTTRDCPKDPETEKLVQVAKDKGWQRCYACSEMIELKEGCNQMTCRCTAKFCMVCGLKWGSCDCPSFNYEAVDAHRDDPMRQLQELNRQRNQFRHEEALTRRM